MSMYVCVGLRTWHGKLVSLMLLEFFLLLRCVGRIELDGLPTDDANI